MTDHDDPASVPLWAMPAFQIPPTTPDNPPTTNGHANGNGNRSSAGSLLAAGRTTTAPTYTPPAGDYNPPPSPTGDDQVYSSRDHSRLVARVDRALLRRIVADASEELTTLINERAAEVADKDNTTVTRTYTEDETKEIGKQLITDLVRREINAAINAGKGATLSVPEQRALVKGAHDWIFGLGPIQHLVDEDEITDIHINGSHVTVRYPDGREELRDPIADSDEELIDWITNLAQRAPGGGRPFSQVDPHLRLNLPGHIRFTAMAWTTPHPDIAIRLHRLVNVDLAELVRREMMPALLADILAAVLAGGGSEIISGEMGSGKTTMLRAIANSLPKDTRIGTAETERELYLDELPGREGSVIAAETITGGGERNAAGELRGSTTLQDILYAFVRMNLRVVMVGEVAGKEILAMFSALQFTPSSMTTVHARDARTAIGRLADVARQQPGVEIGYAKSLVAHHVDLIIQLDRLVLRDHNGDVTGTRRYVQEVIYVQPGEGDEPAATTLYKCRRDGSYAYGTFPPQVRNFMDAGGFDLSRIPTNTLDYTEEGGF